MRPHDFIRDPDDSDIALCTHCKTRVYWFRAGEKLEVEIEKYEGVFRDCDVALIENLLEE